jgi:hypothetical protein
MNICRFSSLLTLLILFSPVRDAVGGELYRDRTNQFRIELPTGWTLKQPQGLATVMKAVDGDGGNINVAVLAIDSDVTADFISQEWVDQMYASMREKFPDATLIKSGISYIDNNRAAYNVVSYNYRIVDVVAPITMMNYQTIKDRKIVTISCGGHRDRFPKYEPICKKAISTFVFEGFAYR